MIPITDASRRPVNFPIITLALIIVNVLVFLAELAGGDAFVTKWADNRAFWQYTWHRGQDRTRN